MGIGEIFRIVRQSVESDGAPGFVLTAPLLEGHEDLIQGAYMPRQSHSLISRFVIWKTLYLIIVLIFTATTLNAYRPDHGILNGEGTCDEHIEVSFDVPVNAQFGGEFSHGFYHIEEIDPGFFFVTDGGFQMLVLVSEMENGILLVDAPGSIGFSLRNFFESIELLEVIYSIPGTEGKDIKKMIYSHSHIDHIGDAWQIKDSFPEVEIIAHAETKNRLSGAIGSRLPPVPDMGFDKKLKVVFGEHILELAYHGPIHDAGNIFIYAPQPKILMLVDVGFPGWVPPFNLNHTADMSWFYGGLVEALSYNFDYYIGGHLNRYGDRADIEDMWLYLQDIKSNAERAVENQRREVLIALSSNIASAASILFDQIACDCANRTLDPTATPSRQAWIDLLGAATRNTLEVCWAVAQGLRTDPTFQSNILLRVPGKPRPEVIALFDQNALETPEGIVFDLDNNIYVTFAATGEVRKVAVDGSQSTLAQLPLNEGAPSCTGPIFTGGPAIDDEDGSIYVPLGACLPENKGVWRVSQSGTFELISEFPTTFFPNDIALHNDWLYISDSGPDIIWAVPKSGGEAQILLDHPLLKPTAGNFPIGPNGLALFDETLFVTNSDTAKIVGMPILADGSLGEPFIHADTEVGCDDFGFDARGNIYCTTAVFQKLQVVTPEGDIHVLLDGEESIGPGIDMPSDAVFGRGRQRYDLFITNAAFQAFSNGNGPSILKLRMAVPGAAE